MYQGLLEELLAEKEDLERAIDQMSSAEIASEEGRRFTDAHAAICEALGEEVVGDPLVAKWERQIAQGIVPNLDEEG